MAAFEDLTIIQLLALSEKETVVYGFRFHDGLIDSFPKMIIKEIKNINTKPGNKLKFNQIKL